MTAELGIGFPTSLFAPFQPRDGGATGIRALQEEQRAQDTRNAPETTIAANNGADFLLPVQSLSQSGQSPLNARFGNDGFGVLLQAQENQRNSTIQASNDNNNDEDDQFSLFSSQGTDIAQLIQDLLILSVINNNPAFQPAQLIDQSV